ncbi:hypothetical protein [Flavobacterium kingsejongi]|uniref:DUF4157 domain-containing protein n=1 Tax=Flavobacterium kingsejongi TaxID=1678728 RepID=A0A2S1LJ34_9FLAO|nr:hypothetical protein [Flavobacterium kingsejongi]AWG23782.1 hypothetical protein FK004_00340 [Flavobacterium kingsejongi]
MFLIVSKYFLPKRFAGITIYPFVILKKREYCNDPVILNHERIHLRQQAELLILPFFVWYLFEFCIKLIRHRDPHKAYRAIGFEREAYRNENNMSYLKTRPFWAFLKYRNSIDS